MFVYLEYKDKISVRAFAYGGASFAPYGKHLSVVDAGGNGDFLRTLLTDSAFAAAVFALICDDFSSAAAFVAYSLRLHYAERCTLLNIDYAASVTLGTNFYAACVLSSGSAARSAFFYSGKVDFFIFRSEYGFHKGKT